MNPYRKKFLEDMKLKGFAESTQNTYLREVKRFFNRCTNRSETSEIMGMDAAFVYMVKKYY